MACASELIGLLRTRVYDLDNSNYRYSDSRLEQVIVSAAQCVLVDANFSTYTANIMGLTISPDPTGSDGSTRNDLFINLIVLKATCIVDMGEARTAARKSGITVQEFASRVDTKGLADAWFKMMEKGACKEYEEALFDQLVGSGTLGQAIMTPFRSYYNSTYSGR